jgi:hypothetical protein
MRLNQSSGRLVFLSVLCALLFNHFFEFHCPQQTVKNWIQSVAGCFSESISVSLVFLLVSGGELSPRATCVPTGIVDLDRPGWRENLVGEER